MNNWDSGKHCLLSHSILNDRRSSLSRFCEFFQNDFQPFPGQTWVIWSRGSAISKRRRWPRLSFTHLSPLPVLLHSLVWNDNCSFLHGEAEQYVQRCKKESEYFSVYYTLWSYESGVTSHSSFHPRVWTARMDVDFCIYEKDYRYAYCWICFRHSGSDVMESIRNTSLSQSVGWCWTR